MNGPEGPAQRPAPASQVGRTKTRRPAPGASPTIKSGRELWSDLYNAARESLGPEASDDEVRRIAEETYEGGSYREPPPETPIERRDRERDAAAGRKALDRLNLEDLEQ